MLAWVGQAQPGEGQARCRLRLPEIPVGVRAGRPLQLRPHVSSSPPRWTPISSARPVHAHTCGTWWRARCTSRSGILHAPMLHTLETDGSRGIPLLAYGLYPTVNNIAKLTTLLQMGGRPTTGSRSLGAKLAEALYRTSPDSGPAPRLAATAPARGAIICRSGRARTARAPAASSRSPSCAGYGGNLVALLPNGVSAFRFADAGQAADVEPDDPRGPGRGHPATVRAIGRGCGGAQPRAPMTAGELRAEMVGRTVDSRGVRNDRRWTRAASSPWDAKGDVDVGRWHVTDDGRYCRTWNAGDRGRLRCYRVYRDGEALELHAG